MKITPKCYAQSLYESIDGKTAGEVAVVSKKFAEMLAKNNHLAKADAVIDEFIKIWNSERGIVEATVVSAKEMDETMTAGLSDYITTLSNAKEVVLNKKINKDILGGVIIAYGDKVIDASVRTGLVDLRERMIQ